ncbi:MAG TPA: right-handed parallel beta-helix repeat-containing protein [Nitrospiria bacterium]|nr:right-handed parallel beta-helix repeat-containing protein [Nitrospiria bacterium]
MNEEASEKSTFLPEPPQNPTGGETLVVDGSGPSSYRLPSEALKDAGPDDQIFIRSGVYEDKIFVENRPVRMIGAGRDHVQIFSRRGGPFYLQQVPEGLVSGITFRYVGSDPHSAMNVLDSTCTITGCRITEGLLSGIVVYGPRCRASLMDNEVCRNRESGIFIFAGARPYLTKNRCHANHHFGIAVRDPETRPDLVRNLCRDNMLSGILIFYHAQAMVLENACRDNQHWGLVMTPDCETTPGRDELMKANRLEPNPRGALCVTEEPLAEIGR